MLIRVPNFILRGIKSLTHEAEVDIAEEGLSKTAVVEEGMSARAGWKYLK